MTKAITLPLFLIVRAVATVTVLMDDVASIFDAPPAFEHAFYTFEIDENQIFEHFGRVEAHHKAAERHGSTDRLWYILDRRSVDAPLFRVDTESGWISNRVMLDTEDRRRYTIRILACLESHTSLCGGADVVVLARDVNDNAPLFSKNIYDVRMPLNLPVGTPLVRVGARDADAPGPNSEISYSLRVPISFQDLFEIDAKSGMISLACRLGTSRENVAVGLQYRLEVDATDAGGPPQSSSATVLIHTDKINPNSPVFEKFRYEVTFYAPIAAQTEIVRVRAVDPDSGPDGRVRYYFADSNEQTNARVSQQFAIDPVSGRISTLTAVDRPLSLLSPVDIDGDAAGDRDQVIQLVVDAIDSSPDFSRRSQTVVVIHLRQEDGFGAAADSESDGEIEFIPLPNTIYISSAKPAGANILKLSVRSHNGAPVDADCITYFIEPTEHFELRAGQLVVCRQLVPGEFYLKLTAHRGGGAVATHALHVVVMRNRDKYPVFDRLSYDITVDANAPFPLHVPSFNASLLTGHVEYSIYSSEANISTKLDENVIFVDKITGDLTIFEKLLHAVDKNETLPAETFFVVRARNVDFPHFYSDISVRLEVLHRHSPQFKFVSPLYRFETSENTPIGTVISGDVTLAIANWLASRRPVRYFFQPASPLFGVLANGSVIVMRALDVERLAEQRIVDADSVLNLNVIAESDELTANTKVQIAIRDVNEFTPKFKHSNYTFVVVEADAPIGQLTASDADVNDRRLKYRTKSGEATKYYTVDEENGTIRQKPEAFPNAEYSMVVEVEDSGGKKDTTTVTLTPKCCKIMWRPTKTGKRERFAIALASDKRWQFRIAGGNEHGHFNLRQFNDSTAELEMLSLPSVADKMHTKPFNVSMEKVLVEAKNAEDTLEIARADVNIDLQDVLAQRDGDKFHFIDENENATSSDEHLITVDLDNLPIDDNSEVPVTRIRAGYGNLPMDGVHYSLVGAGESIFRLEPTTGQLYVNVERLRGLGVNLSEEEFELLVKAELPDQGSASHRDQHVYVVRFNVLATTVTFQATPTVTETTIAISATVESAFLRRRFEFTVMKPRRDQLIGALAMRQGPPPTLTIEPPHFRSWFVVDPRTQLLFIRQVPTNLTGRQRAEFQVVAQHSDGTISKADVVVDLILTTDDRSDSTETAIPADFSLTAFSTDDVGRLLSASTSAEDISMVVSTSTTTPPHDEQLTINGETMTEDTMESKNEKSTTVSITVTANDEQNDTEERPDSTTKETHFEEQGEDQVEVELESVSNSKIDTTTKAEFETDAETTTQTEKEFESSIDANSKFGSRLANRRFTAMLPESNYGVHGATVRLRPTAMRDGQPPGTVYAITADAPSSLPFFIRRDTGELIAFAEIDRERIASYRFNVTASIPDSKEISTAEVEVTILDVNDNFPCFIDSAEERDYALMRVVAVDAHTPVGARLTRFRVEDRDEGAAGRVTFRLDEDHYQLLRIDAKTGELFLVKHLPNDLPNAPINVKVVASDGGRPALRVTHNFRIDVFEAGQTPHFLQREYNAQGLDTEVPLDAGAFVAQLLAGVSPLRYAINGPSSDLFRIDDYGIIRLNRRPMDAELARNYALNVTAAGEGQPLASTILHVFLPARQPLSATTTTAAPTPPLSSTDGSTTCDFATQVFRAEIRENTAGRHRLTQLKTRGCEAMFPSVRFVIHQGGNADDFELDAHSGEFFVLRPLDRERKGLHIIVVNVTYLNGSDDSLETSRLRRQSQAFIPIEGYAKSKLKTGQAIIVVRVLDENDNAPLFTGLNADGVYVFAVDAHVPLLVPFARISASDADEKVTNNISYSLRSLKGDYFAVNTSTGHVAAQRELVDASDTVVDVEASATDGLHESRVPIKIHIIRPGPNAVVLTSLRPIDRLDNAQLASNLTRALSVDTRVLASQVFVDENRRANPNRTHVIVYALEHGTHAPLSGENLKSLLENRFSAIAVNKSDAEALVSLHHIANITLPTWAGTGGQLPFHLSWLEVALYTFGGVIAVLTCTLVFVFLQWCKKRQMATKSDMEYMVGSETVGPRPYNVELMTRKMAQDLLSGRTLPHPYKEVTLSPESRATMIVSSSVYNASIADNATIIGHKTNSSAIDSHSVDRNERTLPTIPKD